MDNKVLDVMPREVRMIAMFIAEEADKLSLNTNSLLGGYIFLRFLNPAIATPEVYKLIDVRKKTKKIQRGLILITKIIQNIANQITFGGKEEFMVPFNEFIQSKCRSMGSFLRKVVDRDYFDCNIKLNMMTVDDVGDHLYKYDEKDIQKTYQILYDNAPEVVKYFVTHGREVKEPYVTIFRRCNDFLGLIRENGAPPRLSEWKPKPGTPKNAQEMIEAAHEELFKMSLIGNFPTNDTKAFYKGKPAKSGRPTYYLNCSRMLIDVLASPSKIGLFIIEVINTLKEDMFQPFCLVVDMTLVVISPTLQEVYSKIVQEVILYFPVELGKNIFELYVLNPRNFETQTYVISTAKVMLKNSKNKNRVVKGFADWQQIMEVINLDNVILPAVSRMSKPRIYKVMYLTTKGKYIDQLIKVTPKSILVIDEKTNSIVYEKLLMDIEEISAPVANLEVHMRFGPDGSKGNGFFKSEGQDDQDEVKKFCCHSLKDRQSFLDELWSTTLDSPNAKSLNFFTVTKHGKNQKKVERLIKFSNDSMMMIDKRTIKNDVHFLCIDYVKVYKMEAVLLKIKGEEFEDEIQCQNPEDLKMSIEEGMKRNQDLLKGMATDTTCETEVVDPLLQLQNPVYKDEKVEPIDSKILFLRQSVMIESVTDLLGVNLEDISTDEIIEV